MTTRYDVVRLLDERRALFIERETHKRRRRLSLVSLLGNTTKLFLFFEFFCLGFSGRLLGYSIEKEGEEEDRDISAVEKNICVRATKKKGTRARFGLFVSSKDSGEKDDFLGKKRVLP
jgi:hypothetical protein|tara:strand:+ start:471 stop:824 length:354 start_codon:yes stop_codon:yes gene_type:complete